MNGISPRPIVLTQHQLKASSAIAEAATDLPRVVTDLIAEYASEDYSSAEQALSFNKDGEMIAWVNGGKIIDTIKAALTSSDCDPGIKRRIFLHLGLVDASENHYKKYHQIINTILDKIRIDGNQINLDYVDFNGVNLRDLNLSGASIRAAKFINAHLISVQFQYADLTGTLFKNMQLLKVNLADTVMSKVVLHKTNFKEVDMTGANLTVATYYRAHFKFVTADNIISEDVRLKKAMKNSVYDPRLTMRDSNLNEFLQDLLNRYPPALPTSIVILNGMYESNGDNALYTVK